MKPFASALLAGLVAALLVVAVPACSSNPKKFDRDAPKPPTKSEGKGLVDAHAKKDGIVTGEADNIDKKVEGTPVADDVRASTDAQRAAVAAAPAAQIEELLVRYDTFAANANSVIAKLTEENAKLAKALADERENFAKSVRKWIVAGCYIAAVVCVLLAALRFKAALTTGLAPLAALKSGAFLLGLAGTLVSLAKVVGAWWFEYACYAVGAAVAGWIGYTLWREQHLEQAARAAKVVVRRLDAAYESALKPDQDALDEALFKPLSEEMKAVPGAKQAIHLLRAKSA